MNKNPLQRLVITIDNTGKDYLPSGNRSDNPDDNIRGPSVLIWPTVTVSFPPADRWPEVLIGRRSVRVATPRSG